MNNIKKIAYEKYRLDWMLQHGYTLLDLIKQLELCIEESDEDLSLSSIFEDWEYGHGFNGAIWACYNEFLENEYTDVDYMRELLDGQYFDEYLKSI